MERILLLGLAAFQEAEAAQAVRVEERRVAHLRQHARDALLGVAVQRGVHDQVEAVLMRRAATCGPWP